MAQHIPDERTISAKFAGKCTECGQRFPVGTLIKFNTYKRTAKHVKCPEISYDGSEQAAVFEMWVRRAEEVNGGKNE
jgi:uncharacterized Fe-S center protein